MYMTKKFRKKFPKPCENKMTFQECELAILRQAVDDSDLNKKKKAANSKDVKKMIEIVEDFLRDTKCICYGGTAINNILPEESQFYNSDIDIPDYDFYSKNPLEHAKQLADIYYRNGYVDVEAKAGVHYGTYKVFVNFIPMADITLLHDNLYDSIMKEAIVMNGIYYTSPNYLRMSMYLELSRPDGDISRWEKVLKRLTALNNHYPMKPKICNNVLLQRPFEKQDKYNENNLYFLVRDYFINQGTVFFGGYAASIYSQYMSFKQRKIVKKIPDFDVLCENSERCVDGLKKTLEDDDYKNVKIVKHNKIGEIVQLHYQISLGDDIIAFIYEPLACHSYNLINIGEKKNKNSNCRYYFIFIFSIFV